MARLKPPDGPGHTFHVTGRVNWQVLHLLDRGRCAELLLHLRRCTETYAVTVLSYVIMGNHYHLVLRSPPEEIYRRLTSRRTASRHVRPYPAGHLKSTVLAQCMHALLGRLSHRAQAELGVKGRFWEYPFHRRLIEDPWDLVVTIAYDHRNPVIAGLVLDPRDYALSSARWWAGATGSPLDLDCELTPPFGVDLALLRREVGRYQASRRLDDARRAMQKCRWKWDNPRGRARLEAVMEELGLAPCPELRQHCRTLLDVTS